jgi:hypothetical protein
MKTNFSHSRRFYTPPNTDEWKPKKGAGSTPRKDQSICPLKHLEILEGNCSNYVVHSDNLKISQLISLICIVN